MCIQNLNTRLYYLISVPQIRRLLLRDAIVSYETDPCSGSKKEKRSYGKVRNNKININNLVVYSNSLATFSNVYTN